MSVSPDRNEFDAVAQPKVTIGIPAYNAASTIAAAVESARRQTFGGLVILISDNASTDDTRRICEELSQKYDKIVYVRQPENLGISGNFRFVLEQARTPYFMWLAADDWIEPSYVERTLAALEAHPDWAACSSRVRFVTPGGGSRIVTSTAPLLADRLTNLYIYLSDPADNSRCFALHRTAPLQKAMPRAHFHAYDFAIVAGVLMHGKYGEIDDVLMTRDETDPISYAKAIRRDNPSVAARIFPLLPVTRDILFRIRVPSSRKILGTLLDLNLQFHVLYMALHYPRYARATSRLWEGWRRYVSWRLRAPGIPTWFSRDRLLRGQEPARPAGGEPSG